MTEPTLFYESHFVAHAVSQSRILLIHALSVFLDIPEANHPDFLNYINALLIHLLNENVNPYLQAAAIRFINRLPATTANRQRVEAYFRLPISKIQAVLKSRMNVALSEALDQFQSVWFLRASDDILLAIKNHENFPAQGYAYRQKKLLLHQKSDSKNRLEILSRILGSSHNMLDEPGMAHRSFDFFGQKFIPKYSKELAINSQAKADIQIPENAIPEAATLTFNLNDPLIFQRFPFEEALYLQNKSFKGFTKFFIQAHPPQFFKVSPSVGLLKSGESQLITVKFCPRPHIVTPGAEIPGYICVRNEFGFVVERYIICLSDF